MSDDFFLIALTYSPYLTFLYKVIQLMMKLALSDKEHIKELKAQMKTQRETIDRLQKYLDYEINGRIK